MPARSACSALPHSMVTLSSAFFCPSFAPPWPHGPMPLTLNGSWPHGSMVPSRPMAPTLSAGMPALSALPPPPFPPFPPPPPFPLRPLRPSRSTALHMVPAPSALPAPWRSMASLWTLSSAFSAASALPLPPWPHGPMPLTLNGSWPHGSMVPSRPMAAMASRLWTLSADKGSQRMPQGRTLLTPTPTPTPTYTLPMGPFLWPHGLPPPPLAPLAPLFPPVRLFSWPHGFEGRTAPWLHGSWPQGLMAPWLHGPMAPGPWTLSAEFKGPECMPAPSACSARPHCPSHGPVVSKGSWLHGSMVPRPGRACTGAL